MLDSSSSFTRLLLALPLVSALIPLNGCATIFTGTTDTRIAADPDPIPQFHERPAVQGEIRSGGL
jgi:hypothetical protein